MAVSAVLGGFRASLVQWLLRACDDPSQVKEQVTNLAFYDCPKATLICSDFLKGLRAAVVAKATLDITKAILTNKVSSLELSAILNAIKVIVSKAASKLALVKL